MDRHRSLFLTLLLLTAAPTASAYVDPGNGLLLWQSLVAAIGAVLVFVREPWKTIKRWIRRFTGR